MVLWHLKIRHHAHKSLLLKSVLNQFNQVHTFTTLIWYYSPISLKISQPNFCMPFCFYRVCCLSHPSYFHRSSNIRLRVHHYVMFSFNKIGCYCKGSCCWLEKQNHEITRNFSCFSAALVFWIACYHYLPHKEILGYSRHS